jgi:hypothetical protein
MVDSSKVMDALIKSVAADLRSVHVKAKIVNEGVNFPDDDGVYIERVRFTSFNDPEMWRIYFVPNGRVENIIDKVLEMYGITARNGIKSDALKIIYSRDNLR